MASDESVVDWLLAADPAISDERLADPIELLRERRKPYYTGPQAVCGRVEAEGE